MLRWKGEINQKKILLNIFSNLIHSLMDFIGKSIPQFWKKIGHLLFRKKTSLFSKKYLGVRSPCPPRPLDLTALKIKHEQWFIINIQKKKSKKENSFPRRITNARLECGHQTKILLQHILSRENVQVPIHDITWETFSCLEQKISCEEAYKWPKGFILIGTTSGYQYFRIVKNQVIFWKSIRKYINLNQTRIVLLYFINVVDSKTKTICQKESF